MPCEQIDIVYKQLYYNITPLSCVLKRHLNRILVLNFYTGLIKVDVGVRNVQFFLRKTGRMHTLQSC